MRNAHGVLSLMGTGVVAALALAGCTVGMSQPHGTVTSSAATTSDKPRDVVVTRYVEDAAVRITAHPLQARDGVGALSLDYELIEPGTVRGSVALDSVQNLYFGQDRPEDLRLLDPDGHAYQVLPSQAGKAGAPNYQDSLVASVYTRGTGADGHVTLSADAPTASSVSLFAAPKSATVDVLAPPFGAIADVPVVTGGNDFEALLAAAGPPVEDTGAFVHPVRQYDVAYDDTTSTQESDQTVTIAIASDVLFASDQSTLSDQATAALDRAITQIQQVAADGTVQVIGHTDDVGTDEYNQGLSERRAQAVQAYLDQRLPEAYTTTAEGRGKSEPAVEGTSTEARALNRRVEIVVQRTQTLTQTTGGVTLPDPPPVVGKGLAWVTWNDQAGDHRVRVDKVVRHDGFLFGYLETASGDQHALTSDGWDADELDALRRGFHEEGTTALHNVRLLTADAKRYPADFQERSLDLANPGSYTRLLGDRSNAHGDEGNPSQTILITVVWKDPGTDTVTLEVPTLFRITDIPVTTEDATEALNDTYSLRD